MTYAEIRDKLQQCHSVDEVTGILAPYDKDVLLNICNFLKVNYEPRNSKDFLRNQIAEKFRIPSADEKQFPMQQHNYGGRGNTGGM